MTLVSPPAGDIRSGAARRNDVLHRRACAVFESCATVAPPTLPALASAFADYLLAWREASPDREHPATAAPPQRLHERVARLDSLLRRAEQATEPAPASDSPALATIEDEAALLLAETRQLLRSLDADRPPAQRVRLALVAAWGRYDDALAAMRARATDPGAGAGAGAGDPTLLAGLRDALLRQLETARTLCAQAGAYVKGGQSGAPYINGGSVQR